jgi:hypothetical protein
MEAADDAGQFLQLLSTELLVQEEIYEHFRRDATLYAAVFADVHLAGLRAEIAKAEAIAAERRSSGHPDPDISRINKSELYGFAGSAPLPDRLETHMRQCESLEEWLSVLHGKVDHALSEYRKALILEDGLDLLYAEVFEVGLQAEARRIRRHQKALHG